MRPRCCTGCHQRMRHPSRSPSAGSALRARSQHGCPRAALPGSPRPWRCGSRSHAWGPGAGDQGSGRSSEWRALDPTRPVADPRPLTPRMLQDLRYALRTFARSPALVAAVVVCVALGIGANATIFCVVDTQLFRPPPHVRGSERVVRLYFRRHYPPFGANTSRITGYPLYTLIRESARDFDALAAYTYSQSASLGRGVDARRVHLVLASASYFPLLGVRPALGRFYAADEDRPGGPAVVVLGYGFWRAAFQGDSGIFGRQLQLGRSSYTVVGVAPERFTGVNLESVDAWVPLTASTPELMGPGSLNRGSYFLEIIGRLRPGGRQPAEREATRAFRAEDMYSPGDSDAVVILGPVQHARGQIGRASWRER